MHKQTSLVLVTTSFPVASDGSEAAGTFVADLADELSIFVSMKVVAPGSGDTREVRPSGVIVYRYKAPDVPMSTLSLWRWRDLIEIIKVLRAGLCATNLAVADGAGHIFALWALPSGWWAKHAAKAARIRYSVWTLGSDIWSLGRVLPLRPLLRRILRDASHCYSDGLILAADTERLGGRAAKFLPSTRKLPTVTRHIQSYEPPYKLLFLGRWHPNKGVDLLLESLSVLSDEDWARIAEIHIAGGGGMHDFVHRRVESLQSEGRPVKVSGFLNREEAATALAQADMLLLSSRIESIPVVFSDAVRAGMYVIAMPVGDLPGLLSHGGGVVAEDVTSVAFGRAIARAVRSSVDYAQQQRIRELAGMFDLPTISRQLACELGAIGNE